MKVCIVGTAPASMMGGPYGNQDWEVWACSPGTYGYLPRIDRFFELHRYEPGQPWFSKEYCEFLRTFKGPVYTGAKVPEIQNSTPINRDYLVGKYGPYFFTSSIAWMMAMAIEEGAEKIALYGVDMAANEEYGQQRLGCHYFGLIAEALGIEVGVPPESDLFRPAPLYGVCEWSHGWIKQTARTRELKNRLNDAMNRKIQAEREEVFLQGAMDDMTWQMQSWFGNMDSAGTQFCAPPVVPILKELFSGPGPNMAEAHMSLTEGSVKGGVKPQFATAPIEAPPSPKGQQKTK